MSHIQEAIEELEGRLRECELDANRYREAIETLRKLTPAPVRADRPLQSESRTGIVHARVEPVRPPKSVNGAQTDEFVVGSILRDLTAWNGWKKSNELRRAVVEAAGCNGAQFERALKNALAAGKVVANGVTYGKRYRIAGPEPAKEDPQR